MAKRSFIDRLFPAKYDFYDMLSHQARTNSLGTGALCKWLESAGEAESKALAAYAYEADEIRMDLEKNLVAAFSTPFDRGDIYTVSVGMDKVIEYALSTLLSMKAYGVKPNEVITGMAENLAKGAALFAEAIESLKNDPAKAEANIAGIRRTHIVIEQLYRDAMAAMFISGDPMEVLKRREVYHHVKDASSNQEYAVDILHRIVVRLT
jgi:uncharacterized protein Yka (UPF0111/DUF47 family)